MSPAAQRGPSSSAPLNPSAAAAQYADALDQLKGSLKDQLNMYFASLARLCLSLAHKAAALEAEALAAGGDTAVQARAAKRRNLCLATRDELSCVLSDLRRLSRRLPRLRLLSTIDDYVDGSTKLIREAVAKIDGLGRLVDQGAWRAAATDLELCLSAFRTECLKMDLGLPEIDQARAQIALWKEELSRLAVAAGKAREESWQFMRDDIQKRVAKEKLEQECRDQISELNDAIRDLAEKYGLCV